MLSALPIVVDRGDPGYAETGTWTGVNGRGGENNDYRFVATGDGATSATWQAPVPTPGDYEVDATWVPYSNRAPDAPYRIYDGSTLLATVRVDQRQAPTGTTSDGVAFQSLGVFRVGGGTVRVVLGNDTAIAAPYATYVIADAVRFEPTTSAPVVVDNDDAGFFTDGYWNTVAGQGGYNNDIRYAAAAPAGSAATVAATWATSALAPGTYDVQVTWINNGLRASNAPYRIYDGGALLATVRVDQRRAPSGASVNGSIFQSLGQFNVGSGTVRVVLGNDADSYVIADAVRIAASSPGSPGPQVPARP